MNYLLRLYHTLKPLKARQWWYRLMQPIMKKCSGLRSVSPHDIAAALSRRTVPLVSLPANKIYNPKKKEFCFLNLKAEFPYNIDWDYQAHGLLWTYNLNYFEWLYDDDLSVDDRLQTILQYVDKKHRIQVGLHGYPVSLRIVAWTRFLLRFGVKDQRIFSALYQHAGWLARFLEYHLDGNHLWENAVALVHAGLFFHDSHFYKKGNDLLSACLQEQLFEDGGHVEGSPMYHSLLLWRLLQCVEMLRALPVADDSLLARLERAAEKMLGWLSAVTFSDGTWPAVNDCTDGIAPTTKALTDYAEKLRLNIKRRPLKESQYRMIRSGPMELFIDAADIYPAYQPGHAHADTGSFCLHVNRKPLIVDAGISTYEQSPLRSYQRSTAAHNIICINGRNSSDVWKSFRIGRRARVTARREDTHEMALTLNDYQATHTRTFSWDEHNLFITDSFGSLSICNAIVNLHFHPDVHITQKNNFTYFVDAVEVYFEYASHVEMGNYEMSCGFNRLRKAQYISVTLSANRLITIVRTTGEY